MIEPIGAVGTAAGLASLAWQTVAAVKRGDGVGKLRGLVAEDLRVAHAIDGGLRDAVAEAWERQRVDPDLGSALLGWLASGDQCYAADAEHRWRALLGGSPGLALSDAQVEAIAAVTAASLRANFARAQPDEIAAIHGEAERILHALDASGDAIVRLTELISALIADASPRQPAGRVRFNLPPVATVFKGRETELGLIDEALRSEERAVVTQAIAGLGGVGKSQLAARHIELHSEEYEIVAWISAQDGGIADLSGLADRVGIADSADVSPADRAQSVIAWLGECEHSWLLVLDNVESAKLLQGLLPRGSAGRVLVTSRDRTLRQFGALLTVDVFDEDTATDYLVTRAGRPGDEQAARELAGALGFLPLALAHAGAYCAEGVSFAEYHAQLTGLPARELFDTHPEVFYEQTVASTWKPSITAATDAAALAGDVLELAAFLAPDAIPKELLDVLVDAPGEIRERKRLMDACSALARYSLATVDASTISVHRLLQKVIRDDLNDRGEAAPGARAVAAITDAFPQQTRLPASWDACERLLAHAQALAVTMGEPGELATTVVGLMNRAYEYLHYADSGALQRDARPASQRAASTPRGLTASRAAVELAERLLGAEHPQTLAAHVGLAGSYWRAGRAQEAITIMERVVADRERLSGYEHPATLAARANLASSYRQAGRTNDAIGLEEAVLADREQRLGAEHSDTLKALHNLGISYWHAGRTGEAITLMERVVADNERLLGAEHPDTLLARHNLGISYWRAGRTGEAITLMERVVADNERLLGAEHPDTLKARHSIGLAYWRAGRTNDAIDLQEAVLADSERLLGAEHPDTLTARANLASSCSQAGRASDAVDLQEAVLADSERLLGAEHPDTLMARANLATSYSRAGRISDAIDLEEAVLADRDRLLGAQHPDTLTVRRNLAYTYRAAGRLDEAERLNPGA